MKKISTLLILAMLAIVPTRAQQTLATLNHNDSISVYYGMDALKSALNAAVNGDIITLSSGLFSAPSDITKAVTIRGAGAWTAEGQGDVTIINDEVWIGIAADSAHFLTLEGIYFPQTVTIDQLHRAQLWKCHFVKISYNVTATSIQNNSFYNCVIQKVNNQCSDNHSSQFVNSVILDWTWSIEPASFVNCVVKQSPDASEMNKRTFTNCILFNISTVNRNNNALTSFNSAFVNTDNSMIGLFDIIADHNLWNFEGLNTVFKGFDGTFNNLAGFQLQESIATQCIGNDGTQIGIYGGQLPFDPKVTNPMIKRINVGQRSTADGKLAVDIEVVADDDTDSEADIIDTELN